ncbi:MAG: GntR family transcriptional regulator [Bacteroidales bacterium]
MTVRRPPRLLADTAYEQLRARIVSLKIAPGTPLVEMEICARLRVSRTPVRAAIERLHQEGLVTMTGKRAAGRAVVAPLTADDMRELFLMVGALDGVAARLAAGIELLRRQRLAAKARAVNEELKQASAGGRPKPSDIPLVQGLDLQFHHLYEEAASGPRLLAKLHALHAQRERYVRLYIERLVHAHGLETSLDEHEAIIAAIEAGEGDAADRAAVYNHRHALLRFASLTEG